jgi:argininosuccinate lyase
MDTKKMWSGRFSSDTDEFAAGFHSSISFDCRLYREDIQGSIAHARMLGKTGILSRQDSDAIISGLRGILDDIESGLVMFSETDEDIHMNIERLLTQRIGEAGKKLHTARSRNDQVALDMRMFVKKACTDICSHLKTLMGALTEMADENLDTIMPAYTHMQKAQPTTLAHHIMAYCDMFFRDCMRFENAYTSSDVMPLGSGAVCSTTFPIDRDAVAKELGFSEITNNSMDGVSDRDFVLDFLYASSVCIMHLSRFCEEIVLWSSGEFSFVHLSDSYSTGSSIMPQKKNPDMAELIRGKTGRVYGDLTALLTVMKGLPLAYNKDMQEDKEAMFDAYDTLSNCLTVFTGMIQTAEWDTVHMYKAAGLGFTNATDAADYLAKKGMPFREAHEVVGKLVLYCEQHGVAIGELSLEEMKKLSPAFEEDIFEAISLETCVEKRACYGGPNEDSVKKHIARMKEFLIQ